MTTPAPSASDSIGLIVEEMNDVFTDDVHGATIPLPWDVLCKRVRGFTRRLSALAPARPEGEGVWQPIATAPKDRTEILFAIRNGRSWVRTIGWWSDHAGEYEKETNKHWVFQGVNTPNIKLSTSDDLKGRAYWMRLPALATLAPNPPKVEAWMVRDEDGDANYIDRPPTDWEIEWAARYGKKWKPLVSAPSADAGEERDAATTLVATGEYIVGRDGIGRPTRRPVPSEDVVVKAPQTREEVAAFLYRVNDHLPVEWTDAMREPIWNGIRAALRALPGAKS